MIKDEAVKLISAMDENSSMDDIMYRLHVLDKHHKAMRAIEEGRVYSHQAAIASLGRAYEKTAMD